MSVPFYYAVYKRARSDEAFAFSHVGYQHLVKHVPKILNVTALREGYQRGNAHSAMSSPVLILVSGDSAKHYSVSAWGNTKGTVQYGASEYSPEFATWCNSSQILYRTECDNEAFTEVRLFSTISSYTPNAATYVPELQSVETVYCTSVYLPLTLACEAELAALERGFKRSIAKSLHDCIIMISGRDGALTQYMECNHQFRRKRLSLDLRDGPRTPSMPPPPSPLDRPEFSSSSSDSSMSSLFRDEMSLSTASL